MAFILYMGYSFGAYNYGGGFLPRLKVSMQKVCVNSLSAPDWTRLMHLGTGGYP